MKSGLNLPNARLAEILDSEGRRFTWLAAQIGVDPATITRYVRHGMHVPDDRRVLIARALGRTVEELWPALTEEEEIAV